MSTVNVSDELVQLSNEMLETLMKEGGIKIKTKVSDLPKPKKKDTSFKEELKTKLHNFIDLL